MDRNQASPPKSSNLSQETNVQVINVQVISATNLQQELDALREQFVSITKTAEQAIERIKLDDKQLAVLRQTVKTHDELLDEILVIITCFINAQSCISSTYHSACVDGKPCDHHFLLLLKKIVLILQDFRPTR